MNLTKKQAIEEHRKMWTWIAERIKNDDGKYSEKLYKHVVYRMKREYLELYFPGEDVRAYYFCCEYTFNMHSNTLCAHCSIVWGDEDTNVETGCINLQSSPYRSLKYLIYPFDKRLAYNKALRIANLPERSEAEETDQDPDDGNPWSFIRCHVIVEGRKDHE